MQVEATMMEVQLLESMYQIREGERRDEEHIMEVGTG